MNGGEETPIRIALPRGELREPVARQLADQGFVAPGYGEGSRLYRFHVSGHRGVEVRVFADQDIPIQVALGNYDLAICSRTWVDELVVRYGHDSIVPLRPLEPALGSAGRRGSSGVTLAELCSRSEMRVARATPTSLTTCSLVCVSVATGSCRSGRRPGPGRRRMRI